MKIAVINCLDYMSTGDIALEISDYCYSKGAQVLLIVGDQKNSRPFEKSLHTKHRKDFYWSRIFGRVFGGDGFLNRTSASELVCLLNDFKPDLINIHNVHGFYTNFPSLVNCCLQLKVPIIYTLHDSWIITGRCGFFFNCYFWETRQCRHCPHREFYPRIILPGSEHLFFSKKTSLVRKMGKSFIFVSPSLWQKEVMEKRFSDFHLDIRHIPNGIDMSIYHPCSEKKEEVFQTSKTVILGVAACWNERKGISYFNRLADLLPEDEYKIVLVGAEDKAVKISRKIMHYSITFDKTKLARFYSSCDIFVNLSIADNYPTTLLEALCCGAKLVSFDSGGCKEIAGAASVTSVGDISGIVDMIASTVKNPKALPLSIDRVSMESMCDAYYRLFLDSVEKRYN